MLGALLFLGGNIMKVRRNLKIIRIFFKLILSKLTNQKVPIRLDISVTQRCNMKCKYCDLWHEKLSEMPLKQIKKLIDEVSSDCLFISLVGGEPLLREDINEIVSYIQKKEGIYLMLCSNGYLVKRMEKVIKNIDMLALSLDGPATIHDILNMKGAYNQVLNAIKTANKNNKRIIVTTVLTNLNISDFDNIEHILKLSEKYNFSVFFRPVMKFPSLVKNKLDRLSPEKKILAKTIREIIRLKWTYNIANTKTNLKYMLNLVEGKIKNKKRCYAGKYSFFVDCNGDISRCFCLKNSVRDKRNITEGFYRAIRQSYPYCEKCNSPICHETASLFSLDIIALFNLIKNVR